MSVSFRLLTHQDSRLRWVASSLLSFQNNNSITVVNGRCMASSAKFRHSTIQKIRTLVPLTQINRRWLGTNGFSRPYVDSKYSYAYGRSNDSLLFSTVARELERQVNEYPDEIAYGSFFENKQVTFKELLHDVKKLAKALSTKFDVNRGDGVGIFAYNCYNWIVTQYACAYLGAILNPINPSYKAGELAFVLERSKIKVLFTSGPGSLQNQLNDHMDILQSEEIQSKLEAKKFQLKHIILIDGEISSNLKLTGCQIHDWTSTDNDGLSFRSLQEAEEAGVVEQDAFILDPYLSSPDDLFAIYYTSGTTGNPKGACVTQFTVVNNVRICQKRLRYGRPDHWKAVVVTTLPMFHIFAGVLISLSPILSNSRVILSSYKYDIGTFVDAIMEHEANIINVTPTILIDMLTNIEVRNIDKVPLKIVQSGGAFLQPEVYSRTFKTLPNLEDLRTGYGSSENGAVASLQTIHEPPALRAFTVGPPIDFTEIRVVKPNSNEVVAHGIPGEIQTRGFNIMTEYLDQPDQTREVITSSRWYKSGDIGFMHPHGSIQICGRIKQMIIKGGENIYPEEISQLIHQLECVEDVHVVGIPDKRFGEQVCAWVKLRPGFREAVGPEERGQDGVIHKDDILDYCKAKITYFKVPKYLLFVDSFPLTPTKKVQHNRMTEITVERLGLST